MKKRPPASKPKKREESSSLLAIAQEHLDKSEYALAEALADKVLVRKTERGGLSGEHEALAHCIFGESAYKTSRWDETAAHIRAAIQTAEAVSNPSLLSRALSQMALLESTYGHPKEADRFVERALAVAEDAGDKRALARSLYVTGIFQKHASKYILALATYERAASIAAEIGDKPTLIGNLSNIGNLHTTLGEYELALASYAKGLSVAEEIGNKYSLANILLGMGKVQTHLAKYPQAIEHLQRSLAICESIGKKGVAAWCLNFIGMVHFQLADYSQALDSFSRALSIAEEISSIGITSDCLDHIGLVHSALGDYQRALVCQTRALEINEEGREVSQVAESLNHMAQVYECLADYPNALECYRRARDLCMQSGKLRMVGSSMRGVAVVEHKMGMIEDAERGFEEALRHQREVLNSNEIVAATLADLGCLLLEKGEIIEGTARLDEALELAVRLGEKSTAARVHKDLSELHAKKGEIQKAFEHFLKHYSLEKEIFSAESQKRLEQFNMRVAIAAKENEMTMVRLKAEQAEQSLRLKERDLANTASSLAAQTELLGNFRTDLRKIVLRPDRYDPEDIIKQVRAKLKELPCEMIDFSKFEGQFATVHPEFRAKLETKYPDLTPQEVKMCMLIHVNLKTPAVARLMCLSERTVEKHRENIRKKLDVKKGEDLAEMLRKLNGK